MTQHLTGIEKLLVANGSKGTVIGDLSLLTLSSPWLRPALVRTHSAHAVCGSGDEVTVADLAVWRCIGWVDGGVLDGIPKVHRYL